MSPKTDLYGLPVGVVIALITHVELETVVGVIAGEKEGDADGAETTELGVALLGVAEGLDKLLDGNRVLVLKAKRFPQESCSHIKMWSRVQVHT